MKTLELIRSIPESLSLQEIVNALSEFYWDANLTVDFNGFLSRTLELFAQATFLNQGNWDLWVCVHEGKVKAYFLCEVAKSIDNNLIYTIHQGWIAKDTRGNFEKIEWWKKVKDQARKKFCRSILISSVRNYEAYRRWLGEERLTVHAELLHLKLEE